MNETIQPRVVTRYFLNGKGYANMKAAAMKVAREHIRDFVGEFSEVDLASLRQKDWETESDFKVRKRKAWTDAHIAAFPPCDDPKCTRHRYGFCDTARRAWLEADCQRIIKNSKEAIAEIRS